MRCIGVPVSSLLADRLGEPEGVEGLVVLEVDGSADVKVAAEVYADSFEQDVCSLSVLGELRSFLHVLGVLQLEHFVEGVGSVTVKVSVGDDVRESLSE